MVSKDDGRLVLWTEYFDARRSRREGRRVPAEWAIQGPKVEDIAAVAESLGLHPFIEKEARYPKNFTARGRVLVDAVWPKTRIVRIIAKRLKTGRY